MAQELVSQADALAGALDQAGDVRHDKADLPSPTLNHTQHRGEGGEVVVGDLGLGRADHGDQGGFAHIGEAHQAHIGQQLQLQGAPPTPRRAVPGLANRGTCRVGVAKWLVAPAALAALGQPLTGSRVGHIGHDPAGVRHP